MGLFDKAKRLVKSGVGKGVGVSTGVASDVLGSRAFKTATYLPRTAARGYRETRRALRRGLQ